MTHNIKIIIISLFLLTLLPVLNEDNKLNSQNSRCLEVQEIKTIRFEKSEEYRLKNKKNSELEFYIASAENSEMLRNKMLGEYSSFLDSLNIDAEEYFTIFSEKFRIIKLENSSDEIVEIPLISNLVGIIHEAKNEKGEWVSLNKSELSWGCGESSHEKLTLNKKRGIEIFSMKFCGEFYTTLRIKLQLINRVVYTDEFQGYINKKLIE